MTDTAGKPADMPLSSVLPPPPPKGFGARLLRLVFPARCAFCGKRGLTDVCEVCVERLQGCLPDAYGLRRAVQSDWICGAAAVWPYEGLPRQTLLSLKFGKRVWRAPELARQMLAAAKAADLPAPDMILPVPPGPKARREDWCVPALLADRMARGMGMRATHGLLVKPLDTPPQHRLSRLRRLANPVGAYAVTDPAALRDKTVWLVDDIITTGSTVRCCARLLWLYGAKQVAAVCFAATPPHGTDDHADKKGQKISSLDV